MRSLVLLSFIYIQCSSAHGSIQHHAQKMQSQSQNISKSTSPSKIPGFKTASPSETALNDHSALGAAMEKVYLSNAHAKTLRETSENRPYFRLDLEKDPIVRNSLKSVQEPEEVLKSELHNRKPTITYTIKKCKESKPKGEYKCHASLIISSVHIQPEQIPHWYCYKGNHPNDYGRCGARHYTTPWRNYQPEVVTPIEEHWTSNCQNMEIQAKRGICKLIRKVCTDGSSSREVAGTTGSDKKPTVRMLKRDCWRYEQVYACSHPSENTCEVLRKSSCEQYASKCLNKIGDVCVEWEQTFRCPDKIIESREKVAEEGYKLPRVRSTVKATANSDFNEAVTKLSVFNSIQEDMRKNGSADSINVFKGQPRKCTIAFGNFKNCCTDGKGWGVTLNLSGCDGEEKDLAERQSKKLCVELGTYCAEKIPVIGCIRKKRAYCCFPSKLSRILHEQGRPQIGKSWGEPEHPSCVGFTPEELSRLNFDRLNLSGLYSEIVSQAKQKTVSVVQRNLGDRVTQMTHSFKNQSKGGVF